MAESGLKIKLPYLALHDTIESHSQEIRTSNEKDFVIRETRKKNPKNNEYNVVSNKKAHKTNPLRFQIKE
jgi:hypothetical protein